jgi:multicomponent Na+:H+ antiporter subunit G
MKAATDLLLACMVCAAWLGALGFARLRDPLDRLHCVTFVNAVCGCLLLLAAILTAGPSDRFLKILLMVGANLVSGAAISHITARAVLQRGTRK